MKTALQIGGKLPIYKAVYASEVSFLDRFQDTEYKQMNGRIFGECTTPQNLAFKEDSTNIYLAGYFSAFLTSLFIII